MKRKRDFAAIQRAMRTAREQERQLRTRQIIFNKLIESGKLEPVL